MKELIKKVLTALMDRQTLILLAAAIVFIIIIVILYVVFHKQMRPEWDDMEGHELEHFCADLLRRRGVKDVVVTKGSGDFGIDILAERDGISYGIQCKNYSSPIGVKAVQEVYAGRDYYDCMVGVVMSNQYFTGPAVEAAKKLKIVLWDRGYIEEMMEEVDDIAE